MKSLLILGLLISSCTSSPRTARTSFTKNMDKVLSSRKAPPFSGVVIVERDNKRIYESVQGDGMTLDSKMLIGTISKEITAAMILKAVEQGKIRLTDKVHTHLPEYDGWARNVTVHHLLTHSSGLEDGAGKPVGKIGQRFHYSNRNYNLLGKILERVSLKPLGDQIRELTKICGLDHTLAPESGTISFFKKLYPEYVLGKQETGGVLQNTSQEYFSMDDASGGIVSSGSDLIAWNKCLWGGRYLNPQSLTLMGKPQVQRTVDEETTGYTYGLQYTKNIWLEEYSQSGSIPGYTSSLLYYPQSKTSVVILENVSLDPNTPDRAFSIHENIRSEVIEELLEMEFGKYEVDMKNTLTK